ncbi:MAG: hypothetical protein ACIAZJ_14430 [Gimesia chilikensis]
MVWDRPVVRLTHHLVLDAGKRDDSEEKQTGTEENEFLASLHHNLELRM